VQVYQFLPVRRGVVLASAARIGLARTYDGQELYVRERFFAGGATSVRGYRQDDLGQRSSLGDAAGGMALLVFNEELRFPVHRWLRGVGFVDLGNVYDTVGEISGSPPIPGRSTRNGKFTSGSGTPSRRYQYTT
jgi:outer membrane protein assembly factor BamA